MDFFTKRNIKFIICQKWLHMIYPRSKKSFEFTTFLFYGNIQRKLLFSWQTDPGQVFVKFSETVML